MSNAFNIISCRVIFQELYAIGFLEFLEVPLVRQQTFLPIYTNVTTPNNVLGELKVCCPNHHIEIFGGWLPIFIKGYRG
jgi:hypothetical protein